MLRTALVVLTLFSCANTFAQGNYYASGASERHYVGINVGFGKTKWFSSTENYKFFDHHGTLLSDGSAELKASNNHRMLELETLAPFYGGKFKVGIGIAFEEYALYKLEFDDGTNQSISPFVETFRFDKFFLQTEVPLPVSKKDWWGLGINTRLGWYGFTGVNSLSLFGQDRIGKTWFGSIAPALDLKVYERVYLLVMPRTEYKYFQNSRDIGDGTISHHLFDFSCNVGIRVHVL